MNNDRNYKKKTDKDEIRELRAEIKLFQSRYEDLCDLSLRVWRMTTPGFHSGFMSDEDYERYKNHIGL